MSLWNLLWRNDSPGYPELKPPHVRVSPHFKLTKRFQSCGSCGHGRRRSRWPSVWLQMKCH